MRRRVTWFMLVVLLTPVMAWAAPYIGDFPLSATVYCYWNTNGQDGASITRSTNGTVAVFKTNGTGESATGVTDTEDFDSKTGEHIAIIDTSADGTFYSAGGEFSIQVSGMVVDTKTVNAHLCQFSIERVGGAVAQLKSVISGTAEVRANVLEWNTTAVATPNTAGVPKVDAILWLGGTIPAVNTTGVPKVDPILWLGGAIPAVTTTGVPKVDVLNSGGATGASLAPLDVYGGAVVKGATGVMLTLGLKNSLTGAPLTGIAFNTSGITFERQRADDAGVGVAITPTGTCALGTFTSGCFLEKDTTAASYEYHVPNAAWATGADSVTLTISGVTGMATTRIRFDLVDVGLAGLATTIGTPAVSIAADATANVATLQQTAAGTFRKNTGSQRKHPILMSTAAGVAVTGATVTVTVEKDGASAGATTGTVTETGNGVYYFAPSADDVNCDTCVFRATAALASPFIFYTFTTP